MRLLGGRLELALRSGLLDELEAAVGAELLVPDGPLALLEIVVVGVQDEVAVDQLPCAAAKPMRGGLVTMILIQPGGAL